MSKEDLYERVISYLTGTYSIKDYSEKKKIIAHVEGYDAPGKEFIVSPWDIWQIAINSGAEDLEEVRAVLLDLKDSFSLERNADNFEILKLTAGRIPDTHQVSGSNEQKESSYTVEDAFKWYMHYKVQLLSENGSKPVAISDGVFAIKNELFLPDDFVPPVMMEMVEGSKLVDVKKVAMEIQPSGQKNAIFVLGKHDNGKFIEPDSFYANPNAGNVPPNPADLGNKILKSFERLQQTDEYRKFLLSRVMRNVIFTVETKKKRELGKPMFDQGKLEILEKNGLVTISDGKGTVPDDMTVEKLKKVKSDAEVAASNVSTNWMNSAIEL